MIVTKFNFRIGLEMFEVTYHKDKMIIFKSQFTFTSKIYAPSKKTENVSRLFPVVHIKGCQDIN